MNRNVYLSEVEMSINQFSGCGHFGFEVMMYAVLLVISSVVEA